MKAKKTTYGVHGMMEYQAVVKLGKRYVKVLFTEGTANAIGTKPATYTTSDFIVQQAIENSSDYKRGLITKVREVELDQEIKVITNAPGEVQSPESRVQNAEAENSEASEKAEGSEGDEAVTVEVAGNEEARDYMVNNFGVKVSQMRTRAEIIAQAALHNINFMFGK